MLKIERSVKKDYFPEILNQYQAAKFLNISIPTLKKHADTGFIPCQRLGRRYIFSKTALLSWASFSCKTSIDNQTEKHQNNDAREFAVE